MYVCVCVCVCVCILSMCIHEHIDNVEIVGAYFKIKEKNCIFYKVYSYYLVITLQLQIVFAAMKLKDTYSLEGKL